jgi:LemA protein
MVPVYILSGLILAIILWFIITYNTFVRARNLLREAWSGVDIQLKRRHDLVPNLVTCVQGYAGHEKSTLELVTSLRSKCLASNSVEERIASEKELSQGLKGLLAIVESYPVLKADQGFLSLQKSLIDTEDQLQLARRYYNGTARNLNIKVESFPSLIIANTMRFSAAPFYEIEDSHDREAPSAKLA